MVSWSDITLFIEPPWIWLGRTDTSQIVITEDRSFQNPFRDTTLNWEDETDSAVTAKEEAEGEKHLQKHKEKEEEDTKNRVEKNEGKKKRLPQALIIGAKKSGTSKYTFQGILDLQTGAFL